MNTIIHLAAALLISAGCAGAKKSPSPSPTNVGADLGSARSATTPAAKKSKRPETEAISASVILPAAKPERLWLLLSKVEDWGAWNSKVTHIEPGAGLAPGARIDWQYDEKDLSSTVVTVKENQELAFKGTASSKKAVLRWLLQPKPDGSTLVVLRAEVPYGTASETMAKLGIEINEWLADFKEAAERN